MSNSINDSLLDRAAQALDIANSWAEHYSSTTTGKILDEMRGQVLRHIEDKNLDDLFSISLPALENKMREVSVVTFEREYAPDEY
jgi:hypothetical protein